VDLSQYNVDSFKSLSHIFNNDVKYNYYRINLKNIIKNNWDKSIEEFKKSFNTMQEIVEKTNLFLKDDYLLKQSKDEVDKEINDNKTIDIILNHVKLINDEYSKLDRFNTQLKDLQRCKLGILDFNMIDSNEKIKLKLNSNLDELKTNLKEPSERLDQ